MCDHFPTQGKMQHQYVIHLIGNDQNQTFNDPTNIDLPHFASDRTRRELAAFRNFGLMPAIREFSTLVTLFREHGRSLYVEGSGFSSSVLSCICFGQDLPDEFDLILERWLDPNLVEPSTVLLAKLRMKSSQFESLLRREGFATENVPSSAPDFIRMHARHTLERVENKGDPQPSLKLELTCEESGPANSIATQTFPPPASILSLPKIIDALTRQEYASPLQSSLAAKQFLAGCSPITLENYVTAIAISISPESDERQISKLPVFQEDLMLRLQRILQISNRVAYKLVREFAKRRVEQSNQINEVLDQAGISIDAITANQMQQLRDVAALAGQSLCKAHVASQAWQSLHRMYSQVVHSNDPCSEPEQA